MRTLKAFVLALAVACTVLTGSLMAAGNADWTTVPVQSVPVKVMTGYNKLFLHNKVLKAEKSGTGAELRYRLTMNRKGQVETVIFNAEGESVR